MRRSKERP
jgi:nicotinate-nucleotide--dimethylbenzimidazole phosphoribosyltransferase